MINWNKSAEINECSEVELKARFDEFPSSRKKIVTVCDMCGKERILNIWSYKDLCQMCANNTESHKSSVSKAMIDYYSDHEKRAAQSIRSFERLSDPDELDRVKECMSKTMLKYWSDDEHIEEQSIRMSELWKTDEYKKNRAEAHKKQIGGNDIVNHHVAYDFYRPEAFIVKITRSVHSMIHHIPGVGIHERSYSLID
jgi:hypothetical protein